MAGAAVERVGAAQAEPAMRRVGGGLARAGVREGDRVAVALPTSADVLVAMVATLRSGALLVPVNPALLPHERAVILEDTEPRLVVDTEEALARLLDGPEVELAPVPRSRPLHFTSGTTGRPKGVHSGLLDDAGARALFAEEVDLWGIDGDDRHLVVSPLYHSAPLRFATATLLQGGDVVLLQGFDAPTIGRVVREVAPTTTFVVPTHLQRLFAAGVLRERTGFRLVVHAGAPCPVPLKRDAIARFGVDVLWEFYGSTEGGFTVCSSPEWLERPGTVGRARPGRTLHVDVDGTVWCTPPAHARWEYWRDPARTAEAWRDGAFTVGDLGRLDDKGYLYLDGRRTDLVITGGVNVYPLEVEQALESFPGVEEVVVFGRPDDDWGQRVCAAVVGAVDAAALLDHARARLAPYKVPKELHVVDELPRTGTGKVRRVGLAEALGLA